MLSPHAHPTHPLLDESGYWEAGKARGRVVIFSGAGLSVESGLDTFRGQDGLWENHRIDQVCNGHTWREHRDLVERFYASIQAANTGAKPHDGHAWCVEMERRGAVLITQNVDTLLERAGAEHAIHIHGRVDQRQCFSCAAQWATALSTGPCPYCQGHDTRTNVVFFGEPAPAYALASRILGGMGADDTLVVVGTQASVANPLRWLASRCQLKVVDPEPSPRLTGWPGAEVFREPASRLRHALDLRFG